MIHLHSEGAVLMDALLLTLAALWAGTFFL